MCTKFKNWIQDRAKYIIKDNYKNRNQFMKKKFWEKQNLDAAYIDFNGDNIFNQIEITVDQVDLSPFT